MVAIYNLLTNRLAIQTINKCAFRQFNDMVEYEWTIPLSVYPID